MSVPNLSTLGDIVLESIRDLAAFSEEDIKPLTDEQYQQLKRIDRMVDNSFAALYPGIGSIGATIAKVAARSLEEGKTRLDPDLLDPQNLADLGWLIESLAGLCATLDGVRSDVDFIYRQQAWIRHISLYKHEV